MNDPSASRSVPKKRLRRWLLVAAALAAAALAGLLFLPVPLGWVLRTAIALTLPRNSAFHVGLDSADFRWRLGNEDCLLTLRGIAISTAGRTAAKVGELSVEMPKSELWRRNFAPARVALKGTVATLDLAAPETSVAPKPRRAAGGPVLSIPSRILPRPDRHSILILDGLSLRLRLPTGETEVRLPGAMADFMAAADGRLRGVVSIRIGSSAKLGQIVADAGLVPSSGDVTFTLKAPLFATSDLLSFPATQSLKATVAVDLSGEFNIVQNQLHKLSGSMHVADGVVVLPGLGPPLAFPLLDLRGFFDQKAGTARIESGRVQFAGAELSISKLDAVLGPRPSVQWQADLTGVQGKVVREIAGELPQLHLPPSAALLDELTAIAMGTRGKAQLARAANGDWAVESVSADGKLGAHLGTEDVAIEASVQQSGERGPMEMTAKLAPIHTNRWPTRWQEMMGLGGFDAPITLTATAKIASTGEIASLSIDFGAGTGRLPRLMPGLPQLTLRSAKARFESESIASRWQVPSLKAELVDGPTLELADASAEFTSARIAVRGLVRLAGMNGAFAGPWLPPAARETLAPYGINLGQLTLDRAESQFQVEALAGPKGAWGPGAANATLAVGLRVQGVPLTMRAQFSLSKAGAVLADIEIPEFRPAAFNLILPAGWKSKDFDLPATVHLVARAGMEQGLTGLNLQLHAGPGRVRYASAPQIDPPLESLSIDAGYDPVSRQASVKTLELAMAGVRLELADATCSLDPPYRTRGRIRIDSFALAPFAAVCAPALEPEMRKQVVAFLRAGQFAGADLKWTAAYDPKEPAVFSIETLEGQARFTGLRMAVPQLPGPMGVQDLTLQFEFPKIAAEATAVSLPGAELSRVRVETAALGTPRASFSAAVHFAIDLPSAGRLYAVPDLLRLAGSAEGDGEFTGLLSGREIKCRLSANLTKGGMALPGSSNAAPDVLEAKLNLQDWGAPGAKPKGDFTIHASHWFGEPLEIDGRLAFSPGSFQPDEFELTRFQHGSSSLTVSFTHPAPEHISLRVRGTRIDAAPWLRAAVAFADAMAAPSPAPATKKAPPAAARPAAAPPAPAGGPVVDADIQCGDVAMGPGFDIHDLRVQAHFENSQSSSLKLDATAGAGNKIHATLGESGATEAIKLQIDDAPAWVALLVAPWQGAIPTSGAFGQRIGQIAEVPAILSGGAIAFDAVLNPSADTWFRGRLQITKTTMVRPPRAMQLLALKSRHSLQSSPLVDELTLDKITVDQKHASIGGFTLNGSGFIRHLKLDKASYGLVDEHVDAEGEFFGVGFVISGTRSDPEVFLKENAVIRTLGRANEFDFDAPEKSDKAGGKKAGN